MMIARATQTITDSAGRPIALDGEIGRGGEGAVYALADRAEVVAKLYHEVPGAAKGAKLTAMASLGTERLLRLTAWPVGTLHREAGGRIVGLLMPRIERHQAIHTLYSPKSRLTAFPQAGWPFLVHAAANAARAFAAIHEHGHVIGDVNHGNLVVSGQATVKLIDCDSFQITAGDQLFRCEVGVATHTPPELQGKSFREVTRTTNHDAFGLAITIFQLLFMGRHPFSGAYSGPGEMPLERSISEFRFAYSQHAAEFQMRPPPATPALTTVSPQVAALFERAFATDGATAGRPAPAEWVEALTALSQSLNQCGQSKAHQYFKELPACPWCRIEERARVVLFGIPAFDLHAYDVKQAQAAFNLSSVWALIATQDAPPPAPPLPSFQPAPSPQARGQVRARGLLGAVGTALVPLSFFGVVTDRIDPPLIGAAFVLSFLLHRGRKGIGRKDADAQLKHARREYDAALERWEKQATAARFTRTLQELDAQRTRYRNLHATRQARLDELGGKARERQLQTFLDTFSIERADIDSIGPARVAMLQSYGVETAADVVRATVLAIPGFGPAYTERLLDWRRAIEARFRFDASRSLDRADVEAVDWGIETERTELERALLDGPATLRRVRAEILKARHDLWPELEHIAHLLAQATADRNALGR